MFWIYCHRSDKVFNAAKKKCYDGVRCSSCICPGAHGGSRDSKPLGGCRSRGTLRLLTDRVATSDENGEGNREIRMARYLPFADYR